MKKIVLGLIGMICTGCMATPQLSQDAEIDPQISESKIEIITNSDLMGTWGMEIPSNKSCTEFYNFRSNNELIIKSAEEWSIAQYQYQPPNNRSELLPVLALQIKYDNNEKDCSGVQVDQTGELQQFFIKWIDNKKIQFCASNKGENCFATLNKLLP